MMNKKNNFCISPPNFNHTLSTVLLNQFIGILTSLWKCWSWAYTQVNLSYNSYNAVLTFLFGLWGCIRFTPMPRLHKVIWESPAHAMWSVFPRRNATTPVVPLRRPWQKRSMHVLRKGKKGFASWTNAFIKVLIKIKSKYKKDGVLQIQIV